LLNTDFDYSPLLLEEKIMLVNDYYGMIDSRHKYNIDDALYLDSGCSMHSVKDRSLFSSYEMLKTFWMFNALNTDRMLFNTDGQVYAHHVGG
jgi:hypothetical protein